jgi:hypothetical protein
MGRYPACDAPLRQHDSLIDPVEATMKPFTYRELLPPAH